MRILFLLILVAGILLGIGYPWAVSNFSGTEIVNVPVYDRGGGFAPVEVDLSAEDAPVRVLVDMTSLGNLTLTGSRTALTLTAAHDGRTVLASTLTFAHQEPRSDNPQNGGMIYRDEAGIIDPVVPGQYRFVVGPGDADDIEMRKVRLVLRAGGLPVDGRAAPIGYALMAIGFVGLVIAMGRGGRRKKDPTPPAPKWGRDGQS